MRRPAFVILVFVLLLWAIVHQEKDTSTLQPVISPASKSYSTKLADPYYVADSLAVDSIQVRKFVSLQKRQNNTLFFSKDTLVTSSEVPDCSEYYKTIKAESKWTLLNMYDPGECSLFTWSDKDSHRIAGSWVAHDLWDLCHSSAARDMRRRPRLCQGIPPVFRLNHMLQRYTVNTGASFKANKELGNDCHNKRLAIFADPMMADHRGGPRKVINNLLSGFRQIGKKYYFNPHDLSSFDYILVLDDYYHFLFYSLTGDDRPTRFYLGPIISAGIDRFQPERISEAAREDVHIVAASSYAAKKKHQYIPAFPFKQENVVIIPAGVDAEWFRPSLSYKLREPPTCLFYYKGPLYRGMARQLELEARQLKYNIIRIIYGDKYGDHKEEYKEEDFYTALQRARFAVLCDDRETQGVAAMEIMSMDVPLFVINPLSVQYFHSSVGVIYNRKGPPMLNQFRTFHKQVIEGVFSPRDWILRNFDLTNSAINTLKILCQKGNPYEKYMLKDNDPYTYWYHWLWYH